MLETLRRHASEHDEPKLSIVQWENGERIYENYILVDCDEVGVTVTVEKAAHNLCIPWHAIHRLVLSPND